MTIFEIAGPVLARVLPPVLGVLLAVGVAAVLPTLAIRLLRWVIGPDESKWAHPHAAAHPHDGHHAHHGHHAGHAPAHHHGPARDHGTSATTEREAVYRL